MYNLETYNLKLLSKNIKYICKKYNGTGKDSLFYCEEHDYYFEALPDNVLRKHTRCPCCSGYRKRKFWNLQLYNMYLQEHKRNIFCSEYVNTYTNTKHICLRCGYGQDGTWQPKPSSILFGFGCPQCCPTGFTKSKPAILYYIQFEKENITYYKIGITNRTIQKRFEKENITYKVLYSCLYENGEIAHKKEKKILKNNKMWKYNGKKLLKQTGNTEIFTKDIFSGEYYEHINNI